MKLLLLLLSLPTLLLAKEGEALYDAHCLQCHSKQKMTMAALKKQKNRLKAPPMNLVIERLKEVITISVDDEDAKEAVIVAYIKEYIQAPSIDKGLCRVSCFTQFGEMPPLMTPLTPQELHEVATWSYEHF